MKQKTAVIISTIVTTFSLVLLGGVAGRMTVDANPVTPNTVLESQQMPAQNVNYVPAAPSSQPTLAITPDRAALVALSNAPGASLLQTPQLVDFEGAVAYEVLLDRATLYIDGNNGQVLYNSLIVSASLPAYNGEEYEEEEYEEEEHEEEEHEEYEEEEQEDD